MSRTSALLGSIGLALLLLLALTRMRAHDASRPNVAQHAAEKERASTELALDSEDAAEPRSAASAQAPIVSPSARKIVLAGTVLVFNAGPEGPGKPVAGAKVAFANERTGFGGIGYAEGDTTFDVTTDDAGRFRIATDDTGKRPVSFRLWTVGVHGVVPGNATVKLAEGEFEATDIVLKLFPLGDLVGVTVDVDGAAVPDVRLTFIEGDAREELVSDRYGNFRVAHPQNVHDLDVTKAGYTLIHAPRPFARDDGTFEPMRVVLAAEARVRVTVLDERGQPRPGAQVTIRVSDNEAFGRVLFGMPTEFASQPEAISGPDGVASFDHIWAKQRLLIEIQPSFAWRASLLASERASDAALVFGDSYAGAPIIADPGGELALVASIPATYRIEGVVQESGAPVVGAWIALKPAENKLGAPTFVPQMYMTPDGRFSFEFTADAPSCRVKLFAATAGGLVSPNADTETCTREFVLEIGKLLDTVLELEPTLAIRGRVIDRDGKAIRGSVVPYLPDGRGNRAGIRAFQATSNGEFALYGLQPGQYDLLVRPTERYANQWVRGIAAGRSDIEVRVGDERPVRVLLQASARGSEAAEIVFLHGRLEPREGVVVDAEPLPHSSQRTEFGGWPRRLGGLSYGNMQTSETQGEVTYVLARSQERTNLLTLNEGYYWFGARGKDGAGRALFPIGTGLVRVEAGEYQVQFELVPSVPIQGRVRPHEHRDLAVAIAGADGELLEFDFGPGRTSSIRELGADGSFAFPIVPIGELELRVGTPRELLAGTAQYRHSLTVHGTDDSFVDVVLPN